MFCGAALPISQGSGAGQPEANVVVPVVGVVVVPIRRTGVLRIVVPVPAAFHPVSAGDRSPFSHINFLKRFVRARLIAAQTLRTRSAAFASVIVPWHSKAVISAIRSVTLLFDFC